MEIKLELGFVEAAANNLIKFKNKVNLEKMKEPKFLAVLTGGEYSYQLDNGVYVISIGNLKN